MEDIRFQEMTCEMLLELEKLENVLPAYVVLYAELMEQF